MDCRSLTDTRGCHGVALFLMIVMLPLHAGMAAAAPVLSTGSLAGLTPISASAWNDTAVRKVLHVFALGSHATDRQIATWTDMSPQSAIIQIMNFDEHNLRVSPADSSLPKENMATRAQSLRALGVFWSSNQKSNPVPRDRRAIYERDEWNSPMELWSTAARARR